MKPTDRWLGQPVYKLKLDSDGHEIQIGGKIMSYSPSSARYVLLYTDGSSDGVPVHEIEDHVPLHLQLPVKKHRSKKRRAEGHTTNYCKTNTECAAATTPVKRSKTVEIEPPVAAPAASPDKKIVVSRFVQDTLWSLTTVLDVSDDKQRSLFIALDNRNEQPLAALARYAEEGGLDAMNDTLRVYACGKDGSRDGVECHSAKRISSLPVRGTKEGSVPHRAAPRTPASPRIASRCDQHLRDLLSGNVGRVFSPKSTLPKEPHTSCKQEPTASGLLHVQPKIAPISPPVLVDLTVSEDEEEEENDDPPDAHRRLHFGRNSTILFDKRDTVNVFQLQVRRARLKRAKLPQQNPEIWKSSLKTCVREESDTWGIDCLSM